LGDLVRYLTFAYQYRKFSHETNLGFKFRGYAKMGKGEFEPDILAFLKSKFKTRNKLFVDIGAHHGYFTCFANASGVRQVVSIEPDKINYRFLEKNVVSNKYKSKTNLINLALGEHEGTVNLFGFGTGVSTSQNWGGSVSKRVQSVKVAKLDKVIKEYLPLKNAIVKIDVEGFEYEVIKGAEITISTAKDTSFIVEITLTEGQKIGKDIKASKNISEIIDLFIKHGYKIYGFNQNKREPSELSKSEIDSLKFDLQKFNSSNYLFEIPVSK
jgi:FkbM family methyltransferase